MPAPLIDRRTYDDIVAWTELLASCERAAPGPALLGRVLAADLADPRDPRKVVAPAGTTIDAALLATVGTLPWRPFREVVRDATLTRDLVNPASSAVHPAGTAIDTPALLQELEDLGRIVGPEVLLGLELVVDVEDQAARRVYKPGTVVDEVIAAVIDRQAWVRVRTWRPRQDGSLDPGGALVRIFGRFAATVVDRLNRSLDKHELAFLDLIGTRPRPPRPARVPLTFTLAAASPVEAVVPAGTQVAAAPAEGEDDDVVFETERNLVVTLSRLQAVYVADAETDRYSDRTAEATGRLDGAWAAFEGDRPVVHEVYVACDELLTRPGPPKDVVLEGEVHEGSIGLAAAGTWSYWDGAAWQRLDATAGNLGGPPARWAVELRDVPQLVPSTIEVDGTSREAGWLRGRPGHPLPKPATVSVGPITVRLASAPAPQPPIAGAFNDLALDLSKDFFPFGEQPRFNDTFYLAVPEALAKPGTDLKLLVTMTNPGRSDDPGGPRPVVTSGNPVIAWEAWDGGGWTDALAAATPNDSTMQFRASGEVRLTLPDGFTTTTVNGVEGHWARARLVGGGYRVPGGPGGPGGPGPIVVAGAPVAMARQAGTRLAFPEAPDWRLPERPPGGPSIGVPGEDVAPVQPPSRIDPPQPADPVDPRPPPPEPPPDHVSAPILRTVAFVAPEPPQAPPSAVLSVNGLTTVDHTAVARGERGDERFTPFTPLPDEEPAVYLGFDQPFANRPVMLYLEVEPPLPEEVAGDRLAELDPATLAKLTWEYSAPGGWRPLGALDETQALGVRGVVGFVGPPDLVACERFGRSLSWLRLRWRSGDFPAPPRLRRALLNTAWAAQVTTVDGEILGSGNGEADQGFTLAHPPVQPGQQVLVREREQPPPAELAALTAAEGADAVEVTDDAAGWPDEIWVRWHAVVDLSGSGPRDRHYTVDALTGEVRFGDGRHGLIPPRGQNNIRATYRTGGGEQGNRAEGTIVQLRSGIPYVGSVTTPEPAEGGAAREPLDRLRARGPRSLRHRDRAVTAQDVEDLAYTASADVARAIAVVPRFAAYDLWLDAGQAPTEAHREAMAGRIGVVVVPDSDLPRPAPSLGLIREVQDHLRARAVPTAQLWVGGPEWVKVTVMATVVPTSIDVADGIGARARAALDRFLHPLTGGRDDQGWAFGRKPHRSDLFAVVEAVDGVDWVPSLIVTYEPEADGPLAARLTEVLTRSLDGMAPGEVTDPELHRWLDRALVHSGGHEITVTLAS